MFPFFIEACCLLYCVVYSQCKITQLEKQETTKNVFLRQTEFQSKIPSVALLNVLLYGNMFDHDCASLVFFAECNGCLSM